MKKGSVNLIPSVISEGQLSALAPQTIEQIHHIKHYIVERPRTARRFIKICNPPYSISELTVLEIETKDGQKLSFDKITAILDEGYDVGILSEAGCPGIADPGPEIVRFLQKKDYRIVPLVGPSSIFLALMGSGLNGQEFKFNGYLPIEKDQLKKKLTQIEKEIRAKKGTQIFIETPYRNDRLLDHMIKHLSKDILLCIASDLTGDLESIKTKSIGDWSKLKPHIGKLPTVFLLNI